MERPTHPEVEGDNCLIVSLIPALRAFARTFHSDPDSADDLVQETLTKAIANIDKYQSGTRMKSWLFTIMRNTFYSHVTARRREAPGMMDDAASRLTTEATQEWVSRGREVNDAIQRLPVQQKEVLVLIGVLGVSYDEASRICDCAMGTVKSRLNRARATLLEDLGEGSARALVEQKNVLTTEYFVGDK
jgi:RNA polymerase sigma-70 factor (ECF subfamily)